MNKELILEILSDWNFWKRKQETGKKRTGYLKIFTKLLKTNVVVAIIGIRRSGKSYLMRQAAKSLISRGVSPKNILIVNFEDQRFTRF